MCSFFFFNFQFNCNTQVFSEITVKNPHILQIKKKIALVEILGSKKITCPGKAGMYGSLMLVLS